jgi:hypothetical protein
LAGEARLGQAGHGLARQGAATTFNIHHPNQKEKTMAFKRHHRQRIIDNYLRETGRNMFVPHEFIDWLADKPNHEAYPLFYSKTDAEAAREYRIELARKFVSGLRITIREQVVTIDRIAKINVREFPAFTSPLAGRSAGGGYYATDPNDPEHLAELRRQGASALRGWLARYRGAFEAAGIDVSAIEEIASIEDATVAAPTRAVANA